ncbi:MAG: Fe-S cluster assembly protein SufD [Pelagibacteraceae bacterium]
MNNNFEFNIENTNLNNKDLRAKSLDFFNKNGFPNKRIEEWKFTDLEKIIKNNFQELKFNNLISQEQIKIDLIKDFDHNSIILIDGNFKSKNFKYEKESNIKVEKYSKKLTKYDISKSSLINLNNALSTDGYSLEILNQYKFNKPLIIYNFFSNNVKNKIINNTNFIEIKNNSSLEIIEYHSDISQSNFFYNNKTIIKVGKNSTLKKYNLQGCKSNGFYYKFIDTSIDENSNYENFIFTSGVKFNKIDENICINGEKANCTIQSALLLDLNSHQEIKTEVKHLKPNCSSYQKIKNVLKDNSKGAYQGKIFVKEIAQKTDAYQLSKALILSEKAEFNAKPELEIYADDVKCSHGSTSGNMNEDSIFYLMTRGLSRKKAKELLTKAFLNEVIDNLENFEIKKLIEKNMDRQINGH